MSAIVGGNKKGNRWKYDHNALYIRKKLSKFKHLEKRGVYLLLSSSSLISDDKVKNKSQELNTVT